MRDFKSIVLGCTGPRAEPDLERLERRSVDGLGVESDLGHSPGDEPCRLVNRLVVNAATSQILAGEKLDVRLQLTGLPGSGVTRLLGKCPCRSDRMNEDKADEEKADEEKSSNQVFVIRSIQWSGSLGGE
jgi:hypothetical protein